MRLKTLEMQGFKSFPEKTKLDFNTGMTGIIGPNGSGKSNISDAIRWVLGEVSSRSIRGQRMEDVIFGGTDTRRPMGFAEVSLTFDNTDGDMKLPLDFDEVTITRKYYRGGDSEYMINGKPVRLRDITELFMNTGLGRSGYSIIGQGRISEIISKKSEDRRGIFEEAAGIAKFRYKKSEAERKLAEMSDNLSRTSDILSELESRIGPLAKDSENARKYLEYFAQKKQADVSLWLYEIDSIRSRASETENAYNISKHELEMADDDIATLETRSEKLYQTSQECKLKAAALRREIGEFAERKHNAESNEALMKNDVEHFDSEIRLLNADQREKELSLAKSENDKSQQTESMTVDKASLEALENELSDNAGALEKVRAEIVAKGTDADNADAAEREASASLITLRLSLSSLDGSKNTAAQRRVELAAQCDATNSEIKSIGEQILSRGETIRSYESKIAELKSAFADIEGKEAELNKRRALISAEGDTLAGELAAANGRLDALQRLEEHFDGYVNSVKFVLERAEKKEISGICGPVSKLIAVETDTTVAIETALGANIQNVVVENEESAKSAIALLKRSGAGRATFYPLDTVSPLALNADTSELARCHGYVGVASSLVTCDNKFRPVIDYLLGRTVICGTIDDASFISRRFGYKFKVVTLDGQVINAGGSYTGGSVRHDSGILSRASEIRSLTDKVAALRKRSGEVRIKLSENGDAIAKLAAGKASLSDEQNVIAVMYSAENTQKQVLEAKLADSNTRITELNNELVALDEQEKDYLGRRNAALADIAAAEILLNRKKAACEAVQREENELQSRLSGIIDDKNALLMRISSKKKDISHREEEIARLCESVAQLRVGISSDISKVSELEDLKRKARKAVADSKNVSSDIEQQIAKLTDESAGLDKLDAQYEKQSSDIRVLIKDKTHHREQLFRQFTSLDAKMQSVNNEQEKYTSKLWEEYELTYAAAHEIGYPSVSAETRQKVAAEQTRLRSRIRELGPVNVGAIEEYKQVKERYDFLSAQVTDLSASKDDICDVILKLDREMCSRFTDTFERVNENFRSVFAELFGGGTAELALTDPLNVLECGIEINVAPPGKIIKNLTLLSGGEQVFVAIALFFAILKVTPAPFCLLDEIEAALDEVNVARFAAYAQKYSDKTQFIIITHRRGTMEECDRLYGVTMPERGISHIFTLNVDEAEQKLGEKI